MAAMVQVNCSGGSSEDGLPQILGGQGGSGRWGAGHKGAAAQGSGIAGRVVTEPAPTLASKQDSCRTVHALRLPSDQKSQNMP